MSGSIATIGLWGADKTVALSGYTPHQHVPSPIEPHFTAPERVSSLTFGPVALAAAVARAATTRDDAPVAVLDALQRSTLPMLEAMIEDGATFGLSTHFQCIPPAGAVWAGFVNRRKPMPYVMRFSHLTI